MVVVLYLYSLLEIELLLMMLACTVQFEYALCILETNQPSAKIQNVIYYTKRTANNRCVQQLTTNGISYLCKPPEEFILLTCCCDTHRVHIILCKSVM